MRMARKIAAAALTVVLMCGLLSACGNSSDSKDDQILGTWELSSVKVLDQEQTADAFLKSVNAEETPKIVFNENHTVDLDILGNKTSSEWKSSGNETYTITDKSNSSMETTLKNDELSFSMSGATMIFKKQK